MGSALSWLDSNHGDRSPSVAANENNPQKARIPLANWVLYLFVYVHTYKMLSQVWSAMLFKATDFFVHKSCR